MKTTRPSHSQGPWHVDQGDEGFIYSASGLRVADCYCVGQEAMSAREFPANAHLIAAAPDLLAALKLAVTALNAAPRFRVPSLSSDSYRIASICDRAIAAAEPAGETPIDELEPELQL